MTGEKAWAVAESGRHDEGVQTLRGATLTALRSHSVASGQLERDLLRLRRGALSWWVGYSEGEPASKQRCVGREGLAALQVRDGSIHVKNLQGRQCGTGDLGAFG